MTGGMTLFRPHFSKLLSSLGRFIQISCPVKVSFSNFCLLFALKPFDCIQDNFFEDLHAFVRGVNDGFDCCAVF